MGKRFQDSSNYVFYIVGECFSSAADTHLATDLTCKMIFKSVQYPLFMGVKTYQEKNRNLMEKKN